MKKRLPLSVLSLVAAFAALGTALMPYQAALRALCGVIAMALGIAFIVQSFSDTKHIAQSMGRPFGIAMFAYFPLAVEFLVPYAKDYFIGDAAAKMLLLGLALQGVLLIVSVVRLFRAHKAENFSPLLYVPFVGMASFSWAADEIGSAATGKPIFLVTVFFFAVLTLLLLVFLRKGTRRDAALAPGFRSPALVTQAMPLPLLLLAYTASANTMALPILAVLTLGTAMTWVIALVLLARILRAPYEEDLALIAFPMTVSALALQRAPLAMQAAGNTLASLAPLLQQVSIVPVLVAAVICYYILLRVLLALFAKNK